jgi:hypothetical protein
LKFRLTEHKKFILNEALQPEDKNLELAFENALRATTKFGQVFTDASWNYDSIGATERLTTLQQFNIKAVPEPDSDGKPKALPTVEKLWDAYYSWVWENNKQVLAIKTALSKQLFTLGFTSDTNAFIAYLRTILDLGWTFTANAFAALHNLRASNIILDSQLRASPSEIVKKPSLIFCANLLKLTSGNDVYRLVKIGNDFLNKSPEKLFSSFLKDHTDETFTMKSASAIDTQISLLSFCFIENSAVNVSNADWSTFGNQTVQHLARPTSPTCFLHPKAQLRNENEIKIIIKQLTGSGDEVEKNSITSNDDAKKLWQNIIDSNIGRDKSAIVNFFYHTVSSYATDKATLDKLFTTIDKKLGGGEKFNTSIVIKYFDVYRNLVNNLDINERNIATTINFLLNNVPPTFAPTSP